MKRYSIFEAKARLSELLRLVKQGVEVIVTERGAPIAKVLRFEPEEGLVAKIASLKQQGIIWGRKSSHWPKSIKIKGALQRFLQER